CPEDDPCHRLGQPIFVLIRYDRRFRHSRVLNQNALNLGRTHPRTTNLQHVIGPAIEPVVTVAVLMEFVTSTNPIALDRLLGSLVAVPVSRASRLTLDPKIANFARRHWLALIVENFHFTARHGAPAGTLPYIARRIGNKN